MQIGIDITSLIYQRGVSRYTANLVRALLAQPMVQLSLYGSSWRQHQQLQKRVQDLLPKRSQAHAVQLKLQSWPPTVLTWLWRFGFNKLKTQLPNIEVFHSWDWLQPPDRDLPLVSTIHDLAILRFPKTAHPQVLKMHQRSWQILKERQAQIIAVSKATKKDIIELLGIPSWQISVIPEALPLEVRTTSELLDETDYQLIKSRLKLHQPYLLFVGTREPRKNLIKLIQAWQPLAQDYQLIIAGDSGWDLTSDSGAVADLKEVNLNNPQLRFLGFVTDQQLAVLYGEAECLVYPSLYEGFGLPILEAFYHGTPVITSQVPALVEVGGNACEYVDPQDVTAIAQGIKKILNETVSAQQKRLKRMIIRLQMFNWDQVGQETIKVYQRAIEQKEA
ncbi:MAG: glycosyltransferase [Candidatus Pacebacteria bacterium]|nr:glycosyltransferase [Candidatus Paceibacterota bacterium]